MPHMSLRPLALALSLSGLCCHHVHADTLPQTLPFSQDWSNAGLITASDNWAGVPGIMGYRGDNLTASTDTNPQTVLAPDSVIDVNANQTAPNTFSTGGVTEFAIANPTIALAASGTADAPSLVIHLNTLGQGAILVNYLLRDLDGSADNATQQVALQYRLGNSGDFINLPAGYVADATTGPSLDNASFAVSVPLPAAADNQAEVQVRILTTNAGGNDEWVGIDDILITGTPTGSTGNLPIVTTCPSGASVVAGGSTSVSLTATDADSVVNGAAITSGAVAGITLGSFTAATAEGGTATAPLNVTGLAAGSYPVTVNFLNDEAQSAVCTVTVSVTPSASLTRIPAIQGSGHLSPLLGQSVTTEGVVTKVTNNGIFLQDSQGDGNANTSDGIFVFTNSSPSAQVAEGNLLRVSGTVAEFAVGTGADAVARPVTEIVSPTITTISTGQMVLPTPVSLPEATEGELERFEGMLVDIQTSLTASQNFFQGRYGQVTLSAGSRLQKPTNLHPAGSAQALALADENARRRILLDDGTSQQNINPTPYIGTDNTLRAGDTVAGVTGVIDYGLATNLTDGLSDYKIHPTQPLVFSRDNPRTTAPLAVGGNIRVGSFNVLNYFTTIDQAGAGCLPSGTRDDCRGADSAAEFQRQRNKIIPAILGLDADVIGLMEIENNGNTAVQDLVNGLNAVAGAGTYATVALPAGGTGNDAIRVAMVYKPAHVSLVGGPVSDTAAIHDRPPLAQTFSAANGETFSLVVNHFKSKGSCPSSTADVNADQGDGQGCWNTKRTQQAQALASFANGLPNAVIVGDLNAYGKEEPIIALTGLGFEDQIARFDPQGYSYVFDGEAGYLDHALVSTSLSTKVAGATHWRINADEPSIIDYNTEFKVGDVRCGTASVPSCSPDYYTSTVYRSSDHDPVVVGLNLHKLVAGTSGRDVINGTAGDDVIQGGLGVDVVTGGLGADRFVYNSLRDGVDTITDFQSGVDVLDVSAVLQSLGSSSIDPLISGYVSCQASGAASVVLIDPDGNAGPAVKRALIRVNNMGCMVLMNTGNFRF
jgi:uncharacterized protein